VNLIVSQQEGNEPSLIEVMIGGQGLCDVHLLHHDKTGAIAEAPIFVGALFKQVERFD
jgi:hypothetical protein